jgi:MFS transporter, DHA1 family, tetracycline resistance protein
MAEPSPTNAGPPAQPNPYSPPAEAATASSSRPLIPIFIIVFIDVMGLTLIIPLLPFYALKFGATPFTATLLLSVFAFFQLFSGPFLGAWSDRSGRKIVLLTSQLGMVASYLVLGVAQALWMVFAGRIIAGITSGNLSVAQAYISDVTKPEERTKAFGFFGIAFGLGFVVGPAVAYGLMKLGNESTPFFGSAVLSALSFGATAIMLPDARPTVGAGRRAPTFDLLRRPEPRRRLLELFLFNLSFSTFIGGFALYLKGKFEFGQDQASLMFVYTGFIGALIQGGLVGVLNRRLGEVRLAFVGFLASAIGYAFVGWIPSWHWLLLVSAIGTFGGGVTRPALTTLITKSVGPHEQGLALGMSSTLASLSQMVGPPAAGWLIEKRHLGTYGLLVAGLSAIGAVLVALPSPAAKVVEPPPAPAEDTKTSSS